MELNAKVAYIKGLAEGLALDSTTKEGKVINAMLDLLEDLADTVTEHDDALDQVYDELDAMDSDMDDLEEVVYGEDDEDEDDESDPDARYELTCPNCGTVTCVDEATLMSGEEISCPSCGAVFDIEFGSCDGDCSGCDSDCGGDEE